MSYEWVAEFYFPGLVCLLPGFHLCHHGICTVMAKYVVNKQYVSLSQFKLKISGYHSSIVSDITS